MFFLFADLKSFFAIFDTLTLRTMDAYANVKRADYYSRNAYGTVGTLFLLSWWGQELTYHTLRANGRLAPWSGDL